MGASRVCIIFLTIHLVSLVNAQEMAKRMPQGFLGMRGKKELDDDSISQFYKRKPQFFVGVKGKKSFQDIMDQRDEFYNRALRLNAVLENAGSESYEYVPKRDGSLIGQIDYSTSGDNYQPSFPLFNDMLMHYMQKIGNARATNENSNENPEGDITFEPLTNEISKRAADIHRFFGVRGKKSVTDKRPYDLSFRGKFIGVRGKKDVKNSNTHEIKFLLDEPLPKRKSQMGFFGMRGKKWAGESSADMETPN